MATEDDSMKELPWIAAARRCLGVAEIKGSRHNPTLLGWLADMGRFSDEARAWWRDDETPWCGLFVGWIMGTSRRFVVKEWYRAQSWQSDLLTELDAPAYGCIVTFTRKGGGHVGFLVGEDRHGHLMVLGGNQGDAVNIKPFSRSRQPRYFWPSRYYNGQSAKSLPALGRYRLPQLDSDGQASDNEA
jgi:uncharacterized protein (TIGR02594 family)